MGLPSGSVRDSDGRHVAVFVIQREDGKYVALPGSINSYTRYLQHARTFPTREAAEAEVCPGNERVLSIQEAMSNE